MFLPCIQLQKKEDPNVAMCPSDHPFINVSALEAEGLKLLENIITILFTSQCVSIVSLRIALFLSIIFRRNVDMLTGVLNSWSQLPKLRPTLAPVVVSTLASWTPAALAGLPASSIKSVEKAVRILLIHLSR